MSYQIRYVRRVGYDKALTELKVQPVLLTGDNKNATKTIAGQISIAEVHANCLPEDKMNFIKEYQATKRGSLHDR